MDLLVDVTKEDVVKAKHVYAQYSHPPFPACPIGQSLTRLYQPNSLIIGTSMICFNDTIYTAKPPYEGIVEHFVFERNWKPVTFEITDGL